MGRQRLVAVDENGRGGLAQDAHRTRHGTEGRLQDVDAVDVSRPDNAEAPCHGT